ncbi:hypothetical protein V6N13_105760 [Hibiscus sabdariffa]|uniref:Uncharacterized protein n=1 Tax=Hibiscus sabdariffa TaxID=183260 RepID=A0ABR2EYP0_9ROSI
MPQNGTKYSNSFHHFDTILDTVGLILFLHVKRNSIVDTKPFAANELSPPLGKNWFRVLVVLLTSVDLELPNTVALVSHLKIDRMLVTAQGRETLEGLAREGHSFPDISLPEML